MKNKAQSKRAPRRSPKRPVARANRPTKRRKAGGFFDAFSQVAPESWVPATYLPLLKAQAVVHSVH